MLDAAIGSATYLSFWPLSCFINIECPVSMHLMSYFDHAAAADCIRCRLRSDNYSLLKMHIIQPSMFVWPVQAITSINICRFTPAVCPIFCQPIVITDKARSGAKHATHIYGNLLSQSDLLKPCMWTYEQFLT